MAITPTMTLLVLHTYLGEVGRDSCWCTALSGTARGQNFSHWCYVCHMLTHLKEGHCGEHMATCASWRADGQALQRIGRLDGTGLHALNSDAVTPHQDHLHEDLAMALANMTGVKEENRKLCIAIASGGSRQHLHKQRSPVVYLSFSQLYGLVELLWRLSASEAD